MYTREETSRVKQDFWTTFGKYMGPVLSAEGIKINWVNYHTNIKDVHFRMEAGLSSAAIHISLEHSDPDIRELYFEQFVQFRTMLHDMLGEEWEWKSDLDGGSRRFSRISRALPDVSVMNKDQWPDIISFFKPRIIALDRFWENAKYSFDVLK